MSQTITRPWEACEPTKLAWWKTFSGELFLTPLPTDTRLGFYPNSGS